MKTVTLKKPHIHAGVLRKSGDKITVDDRTAEWMEANMKDSVASIQDAPSAPAQTKTKE